MWKSRRAREREARSWGRNPFEVIVYLAASPLLRALARLPLPTLYRISDVAFWIVYRILRLRRAVARDNLRRSFPEATSAELDRIVFEKADIAAERFDQFTHYGEPETSSRKVVTGCPFKFFEHAFLVFFRDANACIGHPNPKMMLAYSGHEETNLAGDRVLGRVA